MHETSPKAAPTDASAFRLSWLAWSCGLVGLLAIKLSAAANTPGAAAAHDLRWAIMPAIVTFIDLLALFAALRLTKPFPLGPAQPLRNFGPHLLAAFAYGALHFLADTRIEGRFDPIAAANQDTWLVRLAWDALGYATFVGVAHAIEYARRYRASRAATQRLESEAADSALRRAEAELRALKAELNPHLMGNALGAVSSLLHTDAAAARRVLAQLADMLRAALLRGGAIEVSLAEEIDCLAPFLAIERARHGDRLRVEWDVDDATLEARLPHMTLQPLIEHVVRLQLARGAPAGIRMSAARSANQSQLCIEMHIAGAPDGEPADDSLAIANVRTRLEELYGTTASLDIAHGVRLALPWRDDDVADDFGDRTALRPSAAEPSRARRVPVLWLFLGAWFGIVSIVTGMRAYAIPLRNGAHTPAAGAVLEGLFGAAFATAALYVAIRLTYSATAFWRAHVLAAASFGLANALGKIIPVIAIGAPYPSVTAGRLAGAVFGGAFLYGLFAAVVQAIAYARRDRGNEVAALRLRTEMAVAGRRRARAQLRVLKAQLNPHFLGNALSVVSSLLESDPSAAETVVAQLDAMLRAASASIGTEEVTLREEIDGLAPFIALERARFGDRLAVRVEVDQAALSARVPHMILQPLLENAVKHGLGPRRGAGEIVVAGHRSGHELELLVSDDGVGLDAAAGASHAWQTGVGLTNARSRLAELYGSDACLDLVSGAGSGTVVRLTLPWRENAMAS